MNVGRLKELAEWLRAGAPHDYITFDMSKGIEIDRRDLELYSEPTCRTSCCIAGAALQFFDHDNVIAWLKEYAEADELVDDGDGEGFQLPFGAFIDSELADTVFNRAARLLELTSVQAEQLFTPAGELSDYTDPAWAARTIDLLIETGEVNWTATKEQP